MPTIQNAGVEIARRQGTSELIKAAKDHARFERSGPVTSGLDILEMEALDCRRGVACNMRKANAQAMIEI